MSITFITGNQHKADYVAKWLDHPMPHHKVDLPEVQSLDLREIVAVKARAAYVELGTTVLVEDTSLECHALGRLPGTLVKWFLQELGNEGICRLLDSYDDRSATARVCYGVFNGEQMYFFEGSMTGHIAASPRGAYGFGWDPVFIRDGTDKTRAELSDADEQTTSMRTQPLAQLKAFLSTHA